MKQKLLVLVFTFVCLVAKGQTVNVVSASDIDNIKINSTTLSDLKKTYGKKDKVEAFFGAPASYNVTVNNSYYQFRYDGFKLDFSTLNKKKAYIESFEISTNKNTFAIKGVTVAVGDNISKLGEVKVSTARNGAKSILYSPCEDCDLFINIDFDASNTITKITYYDMS
ncbi:hypothetical protein [Tenacibaculum sp. 190130A14a]